MPRSDTQFKKGQPSANPGGRPKKTEALSASISKMDEVYRQRLHDIATGTREESKDSIAAIKLLWAYAHGNPTTRIGDPDGQPMKLGVPDLLEVLRALGRQ